jgi:type III pantothenate kinase
MKLLIEAGNSRIKCAFIDHTSKELINPISFFYQERQLSDDIWLHWQSLPPPDEVYFANVASENVQHMIARWVREHWHCPVHQVISLPQACGLTNGYAIPSTLGSDRFLAMIAAKQLHPNQSLIVVDCGTATTIDYVDNNGIHVGGMIVPGMSTLAIALQQTTQIKLPNGFKPNIPKLTLGRNTADAIVQGVYWQTVDFVDSEIHKLVQRDVKNTHCLLTGGNAALIAGDLQQKVEMVPNLVLQGLQAMALASEAKSA